MIGVGIGVGIDVDVGHLLIFIVEALKGLWCAFWSSGRGPGQRRFSARDRDGIVSQDDAHGDGGWARSRRARSGGGWVWVWVCTMGTVTGGWGRRRGEGRGEAVYREGRCRRWDAGCGWRCDLGRGGMGRDGRTYPWLAGLFWPQRDQNGGRAFCPMQSIVDAGKVSVWQVGESAKLGARSE